MKAVVNWLLDKTIVPILLIVLTPIITGIGSKVSTDNWFEWFATTPVLVWVILAIILIPWIAFAIYHRIKHLRRENWSVRPLRFKPSGGWETIYKIEHAGVIWNVRVPVQASTFKRRKVPTLDDLDIEIPPRCPKCSTKLEEIKSFWCGYVWKCVNCGFHKRNRDDWFKEERRVIKLAERRFEEIYQSRVENGQ